MNIQLAFLRYRRLRAIATGIILLSATHLCLAQEEMAQQGKSDLPSDASAEEKARFCNADQKRFKDGLAAIYRDFERAGSPKSVAILVKLDRRIRALLNPRLSYRPCGDDSAIYDQDWKTMGVELGYWVTLTYTGLLLDQAHAQNPQSPFRDSTLFSTVIHREKSGLGEMPNIEAAFHYLSEFPTGPFAQDTHLILADYYKDLFMVLRDFMAHGHDEEDYKYGCFQSYITDEPIDRQRQEAKRSALEHYDNVLLTNPSNRRAASSRQGAEDESIQGWSFCAD